MTEEELREHRRQQKAADVQAAELAEDRAAWDMAGEMAIELVDRKVAVSDRGAIRALIAEMVALRMTGSTLKEIAGICDVSEDTVRKYLARAAQVADQNHVGALLDYHAVPLAVDNLIAGLKNGNEKYTLKVLEGRGHFAKHTKGSTSNAFKGGFTFEWKGAPQLSPALPEGSITGIPRGALPVIEGQVVEDDDK